MSKKQKTSIFNKIPGMNFQKEGKGVREDGVKDPAFSRFFLILKRKFFLLIRLNLMQLAAGLPAYAAAVAMTFLLMAPDPAQIDNDLAARISLAFLMAACQLVTVGPLHAGFISVLRNVVREQEAFVWYDYWQGVKKNWKQALVISLIDLAVCGLVSYMFFFYTQLPGAAGSGAAGVLTVVLAIFALFYGMMHIYIWPMVVSVDLTIRQIYSNALRFMIGKILPNLGIMLGVAAVVVIGFINAVAGIFVIMIIGYSLVAYLETFYAYNAIEKYIVQAHEAKQNSV